MIQNTQTLLLFILSASLPARIPLNHQRTVITVNVGVTEWRAEKARGRMKETREIVAVAAGAKKLFIKPKPPPAQHILEHTYNTHHVCISCIILLFKSL